MGGGIYNTSNGTKERAVGSGYVALSLESSVFPDKNFRAQFWD